MYNHSEKMILAIIHYLTYVRYENENKDQQGKDDVHRTQPPTLSSHTSSAPRRHKTETVRGHKGGDGH
jgi:hypothetical protein